MSDPMSEVRDDLEATLQAARERLARAEEVASIIPQLRRQIREVERAIGRINNTPEPRRHSGPTIAQAITAAVADEGGEIRFDPGGMLAAIHGLVGRHKSSVQVEIHRMERNGSLLVERDSRNMPVAVKLPRPTLSAIEGGAERDLLEG